MRADPPLPQTLGGGRRREGNPAVDLGGGGGDGCRRHRHNDRNSVCEVCQLCGPGKRVEGRGKEQGRERLTDFGSWDPPLFLFSGCDHPGSWLLPAGGSRAKGAHDGAGETADETARHCGRRRRGRLVRRERRRLDSRR